MTRRPDPDERVESLAGGNSNSVERIGSTVHRKAGHWTNNVHQLLRTLRRSGVLEVPEPLGFDPAGREVVSYIEGVAANYPLPRWLWAEENLTDCFRLLRRMHDSAPADRFSATGWRARSREPREVICHNDFAPYNLIFRDERVVGVIDFDEAGPGPRVWDVAYLAYRLIPFCSDAGEFAPRHDERRGRLERGLAAYGELTFEEVMGTMIDRLDDVADHSERRADETGRDEFRAHARMYRDDARRVRTYSDAGTVGKTSPS